jgi:hypothetical protein
MPSAPLSQPELRGTRHAARGNLLFGVSLVSEQQIAHACAQRFGRQALSAGWRPTRNMGSIFFGHAIGIWNLPR